MARTKNSKRPSTGGIPPRGFRRRFEKKAPCDHRLYASIALKRKNKGLIISNNLSLQVAQRVLQQGLGAANPTNTAFSPASIDAALSILANGAKGETLEQLLKFLGFKTVKEVNAAVTRLSVVLAKSEAVNAPDVNFANGLWLDQRYVFNKTFAKTLKERHNAEARSVDFQNQLDKVVKEANSWVAKQSNGLLNNSCIQADTTLLFANALYFNGDWYNTFDPEYTKDKPFYLLNGDQIEVPFMAQTYKSYDYGTFEGCQVLKMLYKEGEHLKAEKPKSFSMYVFFPQEKNGLPLLLESIKMDANFFKDKVKLNYVKIDQVVIPKFAFEYKFSVVEPLKQLGLDLPFREDCDDLTGIVEKHPIGGNPYVTNIVQKCRVETNEEGTRAFVVTSCELAPMASCIRPPPPPPPPPPINFVADHPFMFMIREDFSGAVLFVGTVLNPLLS